MNVFGMQSFDFIQIKSNLPKSNHFCPNFALILPKFGLSFAKSLPNLTFPKSNQSLPKIIFARGFSA